MKKEVLSILLRSVPLKKMSIIMKNIKISDIVKNDINQSDKIKARLIKINTIKS